jgi:hypothetical protein
MNSKQEYPKARTITRRAEEITAAFQEKLNSLTYQKEKIAPSMIVTILANLSLHGLDVPASIFSKLDYDKDFEVPDDAVVAGEACKKIKGGVVEIDKIIRVDIGEFQLQYNPIRGYRPRRMARKKSVPLYVPFDPEGFHYALKCCDDEVFLKTTVSGLKVYLLFNRYPFAPYHFLWIPDRFGQHSQFLDPAKDGLILREACAYVMEDGKDSSVRLCYNSLGAHASVNHLHFQGFLITEQWQPPFEKCIENHIKLHGGASGPIDCYFKGALWLSKNDSVEQLQSFIKEMNACKRPYCLYITPEGIACFPRRAQDYDPYFKLLEQSPFTTGFAFFEMLGEIICTNKEVLTFEKSQIERSIVELYDALSVV